MPAGYSDTSRPSVFSARTWYSAKNVLAVTALLAAGASACVSSDAAAADLPPVYAKASTPIAYNWSGCYVGLHAGGGLLRDTNFTGSADVEGGGVLTGGQAGCNIQANQFVFGIEGEGAWSSIKTSDNFITASGSELFSVTNRWDTDLAVRLGIAMDRALIYGKVGAALGNFTYAGFESGTPPFSISGNSTLGGLLVGAGFEYALTSNWSTKLEYNFIDFAAKDVSFNSSFGPETFTESATKQIVKVGVNYKFGN
jgi:outer membrane immunogenic protein